MGSIAREPEDDIPWDAAEIEIDGQHKIRVNTTKQIAKQRVMVEWDGTGDGPPPPNLKESQLVQEALENSDYPKAQQTQTGLPRLRNGSALGQRRLQFILVIKKSPA